MSHFRTFTGDEPAGTIIVRLVSGEDGPRAFIRQVSDPSDEAEESIEQSEQRRRPAPRSSSISGLRQSGTSAGAVLPDQSRWAR